MTKLTRTLLFSGVACVAAGSAFVFDLIPTGDIAALHIVFPCGVILLGLSMLSKMLEKESALYDREHTTSPAPRPAEKPGPGRDASLGRPRRVPRGAM